MRSFILITSILVSTILSAQIYTVNSDDDVDDGVCDGVHCSLREAINASETDGVPSTIKFNIPGVSPFIINPGGPFPSINHSDLTILGESQAGSPGAIIIDFNFRDFAGIGFWDILADDFFISGIDFTDFSFSKSGDHIFQFGNVINSANRSRIYNCAFHMANSLGAVSSINQKLISIIKADSFSISNCIFGSDRLLGSINQMTGHISIGEYSGSIGNGLIRIDSNIFVNNLRMIRGIGGQLMISKNIFGALDTSKTVNFLEPDYAISGMNVKNAVIQNNFFYGIKQYAIGFTSSNGQLLISRNKFYNCTNETVFFGENTSGKTIIADNFARHGKTFIDAITNQDDEIYVERNDVEDYNDFLLVSNYQNQFNKLVRYIDNKMTCIKNIVVSISENGPSPQIQTVNGNVIHGIGNPEDSLVVYFNQRMACKNANCQGGYELGRTRCDQSGNWSLSFAIPSNSSISAYQFNTETNKFPRRYSGFSDCYYLSTETGDQEHGISNQIILFPDPVTDILNVELNNIQLAALEIYNSTGQLLIQFFNISTSFDMDMSNYNPGIYYFQLLGKNGQQISKIVKY